MTQIGKEYAEALFSLAEENGTEQEFSDALDTVSEVFAQAPQYAELLSSPGIPKRERLKVLDDAFAAALPEYVLSFLKVLCERDRIPAFEECREAYRALHRSASRIAEVTVTSAVALSDRQKELLIGKLEKMSGKTVRPQFAVDPSLLGGVSVKMEDKILDGSLKHRLREIKEVMEQ